MGFLAEEKLQDNQSGRESPMPTIPAFYGPTISPGPAPFRFSAHQTRINWQILHGVDIDKLVRETDIDTLERCCAAMAYGDLQAEQPGSLSETNFLRLFRLAQLTVEYLLHIQDRLVWENGLLKEDKARSAKHVEALHLRVKEYKEELALTKQEAKSVKKSLKMSEAALKAERDSVEANGARKDSKQEADLMWQVERLQRHSDELSDEREGLLRDIDVLREALEKAKDRGQQDMQSAVEAATRREQAEADRRVLSAKEEALQLSQGSIDDKIAAATEEMRTLRQRLADSLIRQQELETRLKLSSILGESKTTVVAAADNREELERLAQRLRNAEDDAAQLRSALRDQEELGKHKALASSEGREDSAKELEQLRARLETERAERERLELVRQELERDAQAMRAQVRQLSRELSYRAPEQAPPEGDPEARVAHAALQDEVEEERRERALLEAKVRRLQSMLANSQPQQEELIKTIHFLERELELERSASGRSGARLRKTASMERQNEAPVQDRGHFTARASMRRLASAMPTRAAAAGDPDNDAPPQPTPEDIERFNAEMAHELAGAQRPGVRSRFPQPLPAFEHTRAQLEGEMEEELNKSLRSFGVDPASGRLSDDAYTAAAAQLESRRSKALAGRPRSHRERAAHLHSTILWHIHRVASKIRRKGQLRPDGGVGPPTLQPRALQRLSMDTNAWTGRQRAFMGAARRARSSSPVRQGSSYLDRGYDSDNESTSGRFHGRHTLSQSLAADPVTATFGDAYSPLRSAIRPGSFTFKSAQELGSQTARESWVPVSAGLRPMSPRARSPTRLAKFSSAPGDFVRQRSVLARYDTPPPVRARTAGAANLGYSPVTDAREAPYYPPLRAHTAGPSVFSPVSVYTDDASYFDTLTHGASGRYGAEPTGYETALRGRSSVADYTYDDRPQRTRTIEAQTDRVEYEATQPRRTRTVEMQTERVEYQEARPHRTRTVEVQAQRAEYDEEAEQQPPGTSSREEKQYVLRAEKSFTKGFKAGLEAARSFSARAAAEAQASADAEGTQQETSAKHSGGMRRAATGMAYETGRPRYHDANDLRRSRSAPRSPHVRYEEEQAEDDLGYHAQQHDMRRGSSGDEHGSADAVMEEAAHVRRAESMPQREADVPEVELPTFEALVERQQSRQDMQNGSAYSPMGASSPALAQALASQTSEYSTKTAAARTASRLRNASISVPKMPEGNGIEAATGTAREWEAGTHEEGKFRRPEAHAPRGPITSSSLPPSVSAGQQTNRAHAHDLRPYSSVGSSAQAGVKYAPNPVYEGVRTARLRMEESGSGLRHQVSSSSFRTAETNGDNGLYDSARSVTARQQEAHQHPANKPLSIGVASFQQATGPARSASAAPFGSAAGPIHAWAGGPLKSAGSMQPSGAAGLRSYASSPSWGKGPSLAAGLQSSRTAVAREVTSTVHASSIKLA